MEMTREIYWNVGHGVMLPMYALVLLAVGVAVYGFLQRMKVYRRGLPLDRTDDRNSRMIEAVKAVMLQLKVARGRGPGMAHALFFWGFILLTIGTTLVFIQADLLDPLFGVRFLKGNFYLAFSWVLDLAGLLAMLMMLGLAARRFLGNTEVMENRCDDFLMHGLLFAVLLTGFLVEGARMAATELPHNMELASWSPVGLLFAKGFYGMAEADLRFLHTGLWWGHFALVLAFFVSIPYTRFRHLITTSTNYFFADRGPAGNLKTVDLEDESAESFGASKIEDLTWKDLFDADACTLCRRCQDRCPAYATEKPLSPMKIVNTIGDVAFGKQTAPLIEAADPDALWSCTTCRACQETCPASIEHVGKIVEMRRNLVLMEGEFPGDEVVTAAENVEVNGNPLGMAYAARGDWAEELGVKPLSEESDVDILYFVGCYASFDKRNIQVAKSFIRLCQAAGVKVGILGKEEKCCGDPVRKLGNEYLYQMQASENIEAITGYGVKQVVTSCPHCFNTLAKDYRDLGFEVPVEHYTVFLERLLAEGKLKLDQKSFDCTYHDSCYLGRYNDIYQAPRTLLQAAGAQIAEMDKSRVESFCCGAGGGRILAEEKLGSRISETRAKMAADTGAPMLVSNCPFCLTMFEDGIKGADLEGQMTPKDLAELLVERVVVD